MSNKSPLITVMQTAYTKINKRIFRDFGEIENLQGRDMKLEIFFNKTHEFIYNNIKDYLSHCRPEWEFLNSKNLENKKDTFYWILEPLSGKENFKRSIPIFSISISVMYNSEVIASSVYDPLRNEFFFAEKGKGAFLNDHRIRVSNRNNLNNCILSLQINEPKSEQEKIFFKKNIPLKNFRFINSSNTSLSWVCSGKFDCFIGVNLNNLFVKSSKLLLREAGGFYLETNLNNDSVFICANPIIHKKIIKILN